MKKAIVIAIALCQMVALLTACTAPWDTKEKDSSGVSAAAASNPIDAAFAAVQSGLREQDVASETYAYLYARLWYNELEHLFEGLENKYFYLSNEEGSYLSQQTELALALGGQEQQGANQLRAVGDFLRSEVLRLIAVLERDGEPYEFLVQQDTLAEELLDCDYSLATSMEWTGENPLLPLDAVPEKDVYLYYAQPFGQMVSIQGRTTLMLGWPSLSPRGGGLRPTMDVFDVDGDGAEEIAIVHTVLTGMGLTYVSADELYIVEFDGSSGVVEKTRKLSLDDLVEQLEQEVAFAYDSETQSITVRDEEQAVTVPTSPEDTAGGDYLMRMGDLVRYVLENGEIMLYVDIVFHREEMVSGMALAELTAKVSCSDQSDSYFTLENVTIQPFK